ncbi:hypothetical protein, partial [Escherichia coli]|uniref:hypothetical protein n=1 Tax=Escherichia coli TaxID=562 RepID=UPI003F776490
MKVNPRFLFVTLIALIGVGGLFFAELAHAVEPQQTTMAQTSTGQAGALTSDGQGLVLQGQDRILARKLARGARVVGYKAGLTSHAKMKQMGVTDPVFGCLV